MLYVTENKRTIKIYLHITEHIWFGLLYGSDDDDLLVLGERRVKYKRGHVVHKSLLNLLNRNKMVQTRAQLEVMQVIELFQSQF